MRKIVAMYDSDVIIFFGRAVSLMIQIQKAKAHQPTPAAVLANVHHHPLPFYFTIIVDDRMYIYHMLFFDYFKR